MINQKCASNFFPAERKEGSESKLYFVPPVKQDEKAR